MHIDMRPKHDHVMEIKVHIVERKDKRQILLSRNIVEKVLSQHNYGTKEYSVKEFHQVTDYKVLPS